MKPQPNTTKRKKKRCAVTVLQAGRPTRRWVEVVTLVVPGEMPRTLRGDQLPDAILLDLGPSQEAESVLEFFQHAPTTTSVKLVQPETPPWPNGRDAVVGVGAVVGFQLLLAVTNAIANAL